MPMPMPSATEPTSSAKKARAKSAPDSSSTPSSKKRAKVWYSTMDTASFTLPSPITSAMSPRSMPPMERSTETVASASVAERMEPYASASLKSSLSDAPCLPASKRIQPMTNAEIAVPSTEKMRMEEICEKNSFLRSE